MAFKWFASANTPRIELREIDRESENYVTWKNAYLVRPLKKAKQSIHGHWFDTWEEARDWQIARYERLVEDAKNTLNSMRARLAEAHALKKPEEA